MKTAALLIVGLQIAIAATLVLSVELAAINWAAVTLAVSGTALGVWAIAAIGPGRVSVRPEVRDEAQLVRSPPYNLVRHPMYSGLMLLTLGCSLAPLNWWRFALWLALCAVLDAKARYEERLLRERFPQYVDYQRRSHRFIPLLY